MPLKTISDPIYNISVNFLFNENQDKAIDILDKKTCVRRERLVELWDKSGGFFFEENPFDYYIVITNTEKKDFQKILAHECLHVVARAFRARGISLELSSEEAYTYYLAYLVKELTKIYQDHFHEKRKKDRHQRRSQKVRKKRQKRR